MKYMPVDAIKNPEPPWDQAGVSPGPGDSPGPWHSISASSLPPDFSADHDKLARSFQELVHYYRHSSVGRRCLGLAHLMNTPLQILSFQLDLLEQKAREELDLLSESPQAHADKLVTLNRYRQEKFRQWRGELNKLQDLSRNLVLHGVHEGAREKVQLNLNELFRQELEHYLAQPFFKHQATRELHFQEGLPSLSGYYIDFSQSFRNLVDNALEAMEGSDRRHLTVVTACRDRRLLVRIGDTGGGIALADLPRIFDPFFTTKRTPEGVRAGLGLFMVRRLLAPYQAEIRVDSGPGGTWVTVLIPVA